MDEVLGRGRSGFFALPSFGQFSQEVLRLDIGIRLPTAVTSKKYLEIQCFLGLEPTRWQLEELVRRDVALVVLPLVPATNDWVSAHDRLRRIVVNTSAGIGLSTTAATQRATEILSEAARESGQRLQHAPLSYNFAREFPLQNPNINRYFLVHRESVRRLLRTFERRNGVRLWCSVRRSGKTTACFDLAADTASDVVVTQTCAHTEQYAGANVFYDAFEDAAGKHPEDP